MAQSLARSLRTGRRALAGRYRRLEETGGVGRGVRFLFLAFATVNATTLGLVALLSADAREALRLPAAAVAIALALWWIRGFRRGSFPLAGELPEAAAILFCGLAVGPGQLDGILWIGLFFRSLYGGLPRALGRALLYAGAYVASVGFEPAGAPVLSEHALGPVPGMLFASGLMVLLASVLARHEAALLRERSLTRASAALARSQDVESILAIGASAALEALGPETSRATVGIAMRRGRALEVASATGAQVEALRGARVEAAEPGESGVEAARGDPPEVVLLDGLARYVVPLPLTLGDAGERALVVATGGELAAPTRVTLESVATLVSLACERRMLADELEARSEERFQSLVENAAEVPCIIEANGTIRYVGPSSAQVLGLRPEQIVGGHLERRIHEEDKQRVGGLLRECLARPGTTRTIEFRCRHADGHWLYAEVAITNRLDDPSVSGIVANFRDVSERRRLEEQIRLSQRLEAVGTLAGGVAHDFNNILTAVGGHAEALRRNLGALDPRLEHVEQIERAARRAATLTRQLLAFSRKQVLRPRVLNLNDVVQDLTALLGPLIGEDVDLRVAPQAGLGHVKADPGQIEQVLMNLAVNARQALPDGGTLTIATREVDLDGSQRLGQVRVPAGPYVVLSVSDTGIGMDTETQVHAFEPFFTTKEPGHGTGLGLATVYGIVKQSGGYVWLESELGRGSTFSVYLPRVDAPLELEGSQLPVASPTGGNETILIVEDEEAVRALTEDVLAGNGYTVLAAASGTEALTLAGGHAEPIDLLLSDLVMPGLGGGAVYAGLRQARPSVRVLYMSGYTAEAILRGGDGEGDPPLLEKPFTSNELLLAVRSALDGRPATGSPRILTGAFPGR